MILVGKTYGAFLVLGEDTEGQKKNRAKYWRCKCLHCSNIKSIRTADLIRNQFKSCGCLRAKHKIIELSGKVFGNLKVVNIDESSMRTGKIYWFCECSCGTKLRVRGDGLKRGVTKSCGCIKKCSVFIDKRFTRLTVIKHLGNQMFECICACGNTKVASGSNLRAGHIKSCGCLRKEPPKNFREYKRKNKQDSGRNSARYAEWRTDILNRDSYTCQCCGSRKSGPKVHHLMSYTSYPEHRFIAENGVTLCDGCHKKFHKMFGNRKTTNDDFFDFLKAEGKAKTTMEQLINEADLIVDQRVKEFVKFVLGKLPTSFFEKPASSSGKYHPPQSNMHGGLLNHSRMVVYLAKKLCEPFNLQQKDIDIVIAAAILHDGLKYGVIEQKHTTHTHAIDMAKFIKILGKRFPEISEEISVLSDAVLFHMGRWSIEHKEMPKKKFPDEYSTVEKIVHLADVVATMPEISFTFINDEVFLA